ncbi:retrovirus-related pol polyprotein from transposon TNT 1-94 [Tanacetum coccineum]
MSGTTIHSLIPPGELEVARIGSDHTPLESRFPKWRVLPLVGVRDRRQLPSSQELFSVLIGRIPMKLELRIGNNSDSIKNVRGWYNASYAGRKKISSIKRADDQDARSWYVVPTGKDNFIVSAGRPNMVPAGRTIDMLGISHETSVARSPQQNGVVERRNHTLHEAARTMLIYAKAPLFLWAKAVATAYFDELTAMAFEQSSSGPALHKMTSATTSSALVPNPPPSRPFIQPSRTNYDILFQPLFDELLTPLPSVDLPAPEVITPIDEVVAPVLDVSTGLPSSTTVDQDAPSPIAHMGNDPYFGIPIPEVPSDQSSSSDSIHTIVHPDHQISEHNSKWTKDHPLENIIGELARPVSIRLQLHEQALFCYYDAFLTAVEPKTYKKALTQSCWIEAMQEELNQFEQLEV